MQQKIVFLPGLGRGLGRGKGLGLGRGLGLIIGMERPPVKQHRYQLLSAHNNSNKNKAMENL